MTLLELEAVSKRVVDGPHPGTLLHEVSLDLARGEYVVVWGTRGSGRSTLLRVAAGVEVPDSGVVRFESKDLRGAGQELGEGIGYCLKRLRSSEGRNVLEQVMMGLLARGRSFGQARTCASAALERCGMLELARAGLLELDHGETVRVALARTLVQQPKLLVIDEPICGVELMARDEILALLRGIADEGVGVLASTSESAGLSGADRSLALSDGRLRGEVQAELAPVVPLRRTA
jgi:ABC-type Mn2+/Zn2+ transport system ATPase subunit